MIRINLLPYREKAKKENLKRQIVIISGALVLFLLLLVLVHFYVGMDIGNKEEGIKQAEAKLAILNKKVGDIELYKKQKKELEQKLAVINTLEGNRLFPVQLLDELNTLVPAKEIWLEKLSVTGPELHVEGTARDNGAVATLMKDLEKVAFIQSVDLLFSKEREIVGVKLQQFSLTCILKRGM